MTELDTSWAEEIELPPVGNMLTAGEAGRGVFIRQGTRMCAEIERCITEYLPGTPIGTLKVLDFGCGVGRIALPFYHKYAALSACDVDPTAVAYLKRVHSGIDARATGYEPPTPFEADAFDVVYAVSVWTHLPADLQMGWLREIHRILRPGGLALITTSSYRALASRRTKLKGWADVSDDQLQSDGFVFKATGATRGVTGTYGYALHTAEYVRANWSAVFDVVDTLQGAIESVQDMNVLRKRGGEAAVVKPW